jgi:hypothetical protein
MIGTACFLPVCVSASIFSVWDDRMVSALTRLVSQAPKGEPKKKKDDEPVAVAPSSDRSETIAARESAALFATKALLTICSPSSARFAEARLALIRTGGISALSGVVLSSSGDGGADLEFTGTYRSCLAHVVRVPAGAVAVHWGAVCYARLCMLDCFGCVQRTALQFGRMPRLLSSARSLWTLCWLD